MWTGTLTRTGLTMEPSEHDLEVLAMLLQGHGHPVPLEQLIRACGTAGEAVHRSLHNLVEMGCRTEAHGIDAIRLVGSGWRTWGPYLQARRRCKAPLEVYGSVTSTQDRTRAIVERHGLAADGAIVLADFQTRGRGRLGRRWTAPAGSSVLFSRGCVYTEPMSEAKINFLIASSVTAVARALEAVAGPSQPRFQIRWPNDLVTDRCKIAGILVESFRIPDQHVTAAIVGVGINVDLDPDDTAIRLPEDPAMPITSLRKIGSETDRLSVAERVIQELDAEHPEGRDDVLQQWQQRCVFPQKRVRVRHDGRLYEGRVVTADPSDGLVVRCTDGSITHLPAATTSIEHPAG